MPKKVNLAPRRHPGRAAVAVGKDLCGRSEPGPMPVRASEPQDINAAGPPQLHAAVPGTVRSARARTAVREVREWCACRKRLPRQCKDRPRKGI